MDGKSHFWTSFVLALGMAVFLILAGLLISVYASLVHADPLQFRTDQYIPPQIAQSFVQPVTQPVTPCGK